jgi:hypothetical protein
MSFMRAAPKSGRERRGSEREFALKRVNVAAVGESAFKLQIAELNNDAGAGSHLQRAAP